MPDGQPKPPPTAHSPAAGCIIMVVAVLALVFLVGFAIWNLFKLDSELAKFTEKEPRTVPVPDLVANAGAVNDLNSKLETFRTDEGNKRDATLTVTPEEINLAVAAFDEFKELRKTFSVTSIKDGKVYIDISFPMRGSPTEDEDYRYLNGTMTTVPRIEGGELVLEVESISVPNGATVPAGFLGQFSPYRITERYKTDEFLGPWMARLTALEIGEGVVTLTVTPGEEPPDPADVELKPEHIRRALMLFGGILVGFLFLMIFAAKRNKRAHPPVE